MPEKKKNAGAFILELIISIAYLALFIGMQIVCMIILLIAELFSTVFKDPKALASQDPTRTDELVTEIISKITNPTIIVSTFVTFMVLWLFFVIIKKKFYKEACMLKFSPVHLPAIVLLAVGLTLFINTVLNLLPESWLESYMEQASRITDNRPVIVFVSTVICAPLMEEIIFRGLILTHLKKAFPVWAAVLLSSLTFGIAHGQILWASYAFLLGLTLCIVKETTGSIFASIIVHMLFNCMGVFIANLAFFFYTPVFFTMMALGAILIPVSIVMLFKIKPKNKTN